MAPNSDTFLLDEHDPTNPIIWYAQTDGSGYLTVTPFDLIPHQEKPQIDINNLAERITKMEENYAELVSMVAAKSVKKQSKPTSTTTTAITVD